MTHRKATRQLRLPRHLAIRCQHCNERIATHRVEFGLNPNGQLYDMLLCPECTEGVKAWGVLLSTTALPMG